MSLEIEKQKALNDLRVRETETRTRLETAITSILGQLGTTVNLHEKDAQLALVDTDMIRKRCDEIDKGREDLAEIQQLKTMNS